MIDPHGGSQNFARRNRGAACIFSDEGFLEKEIHGVQRGVDELFLTRFLFPSCFILAGNFRSGIRQSNTPFQYRLPGSM